MSSRRIEPGAPTLLLALIFLLSTIAGNELVAQNAGAGFVRGSITNAETGEPLGNVNVYLSFTTVGTSTDSTGHFSLRVPRAGSYEIVFSLLGYKSREERIEILPGDSLTRDATLTPTVVETGPVDISATTDPEWEKSLERFTRAFIGHTNFSRECAILNPEVIDFESRGDTLVASSDHLLAIENRALGYRIRVVLQGFVWNTVMDHGHFVIHPWFEQLETTDSDLQAQWYANRETAFNGSSRHFFKSLIERNSFDEAFMMYSGPVNTLVAGGGHQVVDADFPVEPVEGIPVYSIQFPGYIRIEYGTYGTIVTGTEDNRYRGDARWRNLPPPPLVSIIRMTGTAIIVDSSGSLLDPMSMEVSGDWARRRIEHLLPRD